MSTVYMKKKQPQQGHHHTYAMGHPLSERTTPKKRKNSTISVEFRKKDTTITNIHLPLKQLDQKSLVTPLRVSCCTNG